MDPTRESEELVGLWQELQEAQVAGDAGRIASIGARAAGESRREGASGEWALLAREAGRDVERLQEDVVAEPTANIGDGAVPVPLDTETSVGTESAPEPAESGRRVNKKGSLIWLAFVLGWVVLQIVQGFGDGG